MFITELFIRLILEKKIKLVPLNIELGPYSRTSYDMSWAFSKSLRISAVRIWNDILSNSANRDVNVFFSLFKKRLIEYCPH